jgi:hypothetical protein
MKKKISVMDVKTALLDQRFRATLPEAFLPDVQKFLANPGCACNHPIYRRVMKEAAAQLLEYYPTLDPGDPDDEKNVKNHWIVINCSISELQAKLRALGPGRKQIEVARYQDQVTVIVNDLDAAQF